MSDLLAECDWRDGTLFLVLPEDPERIGVRLFPSRYAPTRMYVPEAEIVLTKAENAKLRELLQDYHRYEHEDCYSCRYVNECQADESGRCIAPMRLGERYRELGVEVNE